MTVEIKGFGKITASKAVLNRLSIYAAESAKYYENNNADGLAVQANKVADEIYDALKAKNYYDD